MAIVYMWFDDDPTYGHLSVDVNVPDFSRIPKQVAEIRLCEIPDSVLDFAVQGGLPIDGAEATEHHGNDEVWQPYWDASATQQVWQRPTKETTP